MVHKTMKYRLQINRDKLVPGLWVHWRGTSFVSRAIRRMLTIWERRTCATYHLPLCGWRIWGNHDGIVIHRNGSWYIGEALAHGSVATPIEDYEQEINEGTGELMFLRPTSLSENEPAPDNEKLALAAYYWQANIEGTKYDYAAYPGLIVDCFFAGLWPRPGNRKNHFCTEGIDSPYCTADMDVLQDNTPTPMHVERAAGMIPQRPDRRVTMEILPDMYVASKNNEEDGK